MYMYLWGEFEIKPLICFFPLLQRQSEFRFVIDFITDLKVTTHGKLLYSLSLLSLQVAGI